MKILCTKNSAMEIRGVLAIADQHLCDVYANLKEWELVLNQMPCGVDWDQMQTKLLRMMDSVQQSVDAVKKIQQSTAQLRQAGKIKDDQWRIAEREEAVIRAQREQEAREEAWQASRAQREQAAATWKRQEEELRQQLERLRQETAKEERALVAAEGRRQALEEREQALEAKERSLADWEAALNQADSLRKDRSGAMAALKEIQAAMAETQRTIRQLGPEFNAVSERVNGGFVSGGLRSLIRCCRSLRQAGTREAGYYADELEWILANNFGCESILPTDGAEFDPLTMVRQDAAAGGNRVARTVCCGWRLGEHILGKAVIIPAEV